MMRGSNRITRWGTARLAGRVSRGMPVLGLGLAALALGGAIRRKGLLRGSLDTGLNATPFVGAMKGAWEWWRGRDLLPDRRPRVR
jgi:hypothetical protein